MINKEIYDFCITITTYNRFDMLSKLINQIKNQQKNYKIKIIVIDDCSDYNLELPKDILYVKHFPNKGKKNFWKIIDMSFKYVKNINSKYYIYLQDDIILKDNFFELTVNNYNNIKDENKICLTFRTDQRTEKSNWTNFSPIKIGNLIKTQWVELDFICQKNFFEVLDYKINEISRHRWDKNPNLSSGVGQQISVRLYNLKKNMYHTQLSIVKHGNQESKMNKKERLITKLITYD